MKRITWLAAVGWLLVAGPVAAGQWQLIAPGVERMIQADGTKAYRQVSQPTPAPTAEPEPVPTQEVGNTPVALPPADTQPVASQPQAELQPIKSKIYKYRDQNGVVTYQSAMPQGFAFEVFKPRQDCFACMTSSTVNWETTPLFRGRYEQEIQRYASRHGVSPALVKAVIHAESAFNPRARSKAGAQGLMQLMPGTAAELGVSSPFDPEQNIDGGVRYLAMLLKMYNNDMRLATAAYNAGPGAVKRYNGVPNYAETKAYVQRVAILERRYR